MLGPKEKKRALDSDCMLVILLFNLVNKSTGALYLLKINKELLAKVRITVSLVIKKLLHCTKKLQLNSPPYRV